MAPIVRPLALGEAEIHLYGVIGEDITAKDIAAELKALGPVRLLHLRINSPGGVTPEAAALNALFNQRRHAGTRIVGHVDGVAASAASWVLVASTDEAFIAEDALIMMHNPGVAWISGTATELRRGADVLDKVTRTMVDDYAARMKLPHAEIERMMDEETWFDAEEAVSAGLVNAISPAMRVAAQVDLSRLALKHPPKTLAELSAAYWARRRPQRVAALDSRTIWNRWNRRAS